VVTNTNSAVNGTQTATVTSEVVRIDVAAAKTYHTIAFYDKNLDLADSFANLPTGYRVDLDSNATERGVSAWYLKGESEPVTSFSVFNSDVNFYALPNVKEITTQVELADIGANATTLSGNYILLNDIALDDSVYGVHATSGWNPIGNGSDANSRFKGVFNGRNHKITNLWISKPTVDYVGLFGFIDGGKIVNLGVEIASDKEVRGQNNVGAIAGYVNNNSTIAGSYSNGSVRGVSRVGGIAGYVRGESGGRSSIAGSYATGDVNGTGSDGYVGGIVGYVTGSSTITDSYATGNVKGIDYIGGIAGYAISGSTIAGSHATGDVNGSSYVGGIAGYIESSSTTITDSYSNGNVKGESLVGGIAGRVNSGSITNSYATGNVIGSSYYVGGIAGRVINGSVRNSYATGDVNGLNDYVGGIAGEIHSNSSITDSYATGDVNGSSYIGGIAGDVYSGSYTAVISNSYATGDVSGSSYIGGIAGNLSGVNPVIQNNAAINPNVTASSGNADRVVGYTYGTSNAIQNNFALATMALTGDNPENGDSGAVEKTIDELKTKATYQNPAGGLGWLFGSSDASPWKHDASKNDGLPYFYWQNL
jgi:hypothetical protein